MPPISSRSTAVRSHLPTPVRMSTLEEIDALINDQRVIKASNDDSHLERARVLRKTNDTFDGSTTATEIRQGTDGTTFQTRYLDASIGTHGGTGGHFRDLTSSLVLDKAGVEYLVKNGKKTNVVGERLAQIKEVFAKVPHPNDPNALKWGKAPEFTLPSGEKAVVFAGWFFVQARNGTYSKLELTPGVDGLNR